MTDFQRAYLYAINNFDEETIKRLFQQLREEIRDLPLEADDDMLDPDVAHVLRQHGCTIEQHEDFQRVIFPKGTANRQYLRTSVDYCILTLPDGFKVKKIGKPDRKYSFLYILEEGNHAGYPHNLIA